MITMEERGQLSAEYILFFGLILVIILAFAYYVSDQSEQNNIATAARIGAENATTEMGILNSTMAPVRVTAIQMTGTQNITISISLSYKPPGVQNSILNSVYNSLVSQGYNPQKNIVSNNIQDLTLNTSKHNYNISLA
ncbi:MAG: class III signal peptide-containing protein [Methanobacterium sp.]|jgi:uncharacterized protein (UPF0333 family)|nr:class III signal peptide-containing protein [Methanobacterium sp.]